MAGERARAAQRDRGGDAARRSVVAAPEDFATVTRHTTGVTFRLPPEGVNLEDVERQLLVQALERTGGNQTTAGRLLGINRDQVRYRIEKFGLVRPQANAHLSSQSAANQ